MMQEGPPDDCIHGIPENVPCPEYIDMRWRADYEALEAEFKQERDTTDFLERLIEALYGQGWKSLTICEARKLKVIPLDTPGESPPHA